MNPSPFIFFGTPDVASETLQRLSDVGFVPALIVTGPDRPSGRGMHMTPPPTKTWADEHGIPVIQPEKIDPETVSFIREQVAKFGITTFIVVAYGKILPQTLIDIPPHGTYNIHYSLLPRWRGASPTEAAILYGDTETGVSIQKMVFKLDAGPVVASDTIPVAADDTTTTLRAKLIHLGADVLIKILPDILAGVALPETIQDESLMTHSGKFSKTDGQINPATDDHETMWRTYRALGHNPGVYFTEHDEHIKVKHAKYENGTFIIARITRPGKPETDY